MRALAVGVCAAALGLFAAVPAQATDQTLRTTIRQQEHQFKPDAKAFDKAVAKADTVQDLIATKQPAQQLATDAGNFSNAVSAQQASTKRVQRGQKVLVKALGEFAGGLNNYVAAINQLEQNQSDTTVKKTLRVSLRQLARANRDSARAGKLIGMKL
jgi:membrane-bound lytic murein transglycosylase B